MTVSHYFSHFIGTFIYMAPENRLSQMSTTKSDIFSLGIILFELLTNFDTDMERAVMLNKLRSSGNIPQFLTDQFPAQSNMLSELIAPDPKDRPTAEEILSSGIIFKDSRRVTISSFGDSASPSSGTDFPGKLGMYPRLRETISALSLDTPNSEEFLNARHRRMTEEWGPFHFVQGEDDHFSKFSSSYNPQNARAFYHGTKANGVSASYKQINDLTDADPKLRILELERDVAYLEAKLKAMTDYYKNIESELERSPVESLPISSENLSTPIPIPFQK
jgi:serine/threonine protein kinase